MERSRRGCDGRIFAGRKRFAATVVTEEFFARRIRFKAPRSEKRSILRLFFVLLWYRYPLDYQQKGNDS